MATRSRSLYRVIRFDKLPCKGGRFIKIKLKIEKKQTKNESVSHFGAIRNLTNDTYKYIKTMMDEMDLKMVLR